MSKFCTKRRNILIIVAIILVVLLGGVVYKTYPMIYGKLYSGNHIKLDLTISYKGKQLDIDDYKIECINPEGKNESISKQGTQYAVKGGEYGRYSFVITINSNVMDETVTQIEEVIIELKFLNANDWYITNSNCVIEIENKEGLIKCDSKINTEYNNGKLTDYSEEKQIENGKVEFAWGN